LTAVDLASGWRRQKDPSSWRGRARLRATVWTNILAKEVRYSIPTYVHGRFKITIAVPPVNDTDVYAHDIGLIAIASESTGGLLGFNVLVGGGMGMTHGSKKTYARLGQDLGFCLPNEVSEVAEAVMLVQRDNGDRTNRKHAR
jgi:sulfite reductase (NADPH) hemoprotein beta-component